MVTGQAPLALLSWTTETGDASTLFEPCLHTRRGASGLGSDNTTGYANPAVDAAIERAASEMRPESRLGELREIMRLALDDRPLIPLYSGLWTYGVGPAVEYAPRLDTLVVAADLKPAAADLKPAR